MTEDEKAETEGLTEDEKAEIERLCDDVIHQLIDEPWDREQRAKKTKALLSKIVEVVTR